MTTELEKQFFDTFGIEPKELIFRTMNCACGCHDCKNCEKYKNNCNKLGFLMSITELGKAEKNSADLYI